MKTKMLRQMVVTMAVLSTGISSFASTSVDMRDPKMIEQQEAAKQDGGRDLTGKVLTAGSGSAADSLSAARSRAFVQASLADAALYTDGPIVNR